MTDSRETWALDREIVLSRVLDAPREMVFEAWTDPDQVTAWFGPEGFKTETQSIDMRVGGLWRFTFEAPDGTLYTNRMHFLRIEHPTLIEFDHGSDIDDDPTRFRVTLTFDAQADGKTVFTLRQLHPTREQRDGGIAFGAVAIGYTTLDKLAAHLAAK